MKNIKKMSPFDMAQKIKKTSRRLTKRLAALDAPNIKPLITFGDILNSRG